MTDLIRLIVEIVQLLFPFRLVSPWERGVFYVFGRTWLTVGAGCYPVLPWFMDIRKVLVKPQPWPIPLQGITLRDGRHLTFSATATLTVFDPVAALENVAEWQESSMEKISGLISDELAVVDTQRFEPSYGKRSNLIEELRKKANEMTSEFGVRVDKIQFPNFLIGVRTYRLLVERATFTETTIGVM